MYLVFKVYEDDRGWRYKVMGGIGPDVFKARYCKPDRPKSWKGLACVPWRKTMDLAQKDLDSVASKKHWKVC
jgi:hypothetical protein